MAISVYLENQVHDRTYTGGHVSESLTRILAEHRADGILDEIYPHGDTMFNSVQLRRLMTQLEKIADENAGIRSDVNSLTEIAMTAIRNRGYLWFSGD